MKPIAAALVGIFGFGFGTFLALRDQGAFTVLICILAFFLALVILVSDKQPKPAAAATAVNEAKSIE